MRLHLSPTRPTPLRLLVGTVALATALCLGTVASAQESAEEPVEQSVSVDVVQRSLSVDPEDSFYITVDVDVAAPTEYLEVRLRIFNPGGRLLYQKTEIRPDLEPGTVSVPYERELADLNVPEGRYPVEVRVLASDADPTVIEDRLLVVASDREPLQVALVARIACSPARNPEGRFVDRPREVDAVRDQTLAVARLAGPTRPVAIGVPPITLEDWLVASMGFDAVGPGGVESVPEDDPASTAYGDALSNLAGLVDEGAVELLDVPYAEPDLAGLIAMDAMGDLEDHYRMGRTIYQAALSATPAGTTAISGDSFPAGAASTLVERDIEAVLLDPAAAGASPGVHTLDAGPVALVLDDQASAALDDPSEFADRLFDAAVENDAGVLVAQLWFGHGSEGGPDALAAALDVAEALEWVDLVSTTEAAERASDSTASLPAQSDQGSAAPLGYWGEVLEARRLTKALGTAAGMDDPDAQLVQRQVLMAESRCWAGPDGGWGLVDRGRAYAGAAARGSEAVLAAVSVSSEDITLAGRSGKVPLSLVNDSDKRLAVTVTASGDHARIGPPSELEVTLRPAENFVTLPVSMTTAVSDRLKVEVRAGDIIITTTYVDVRASYLDRLGVAGLVVLVLFALLFYIRRRVMS